MCKKKIFLYAYESTVDLFLINGQNEKFKAIEVNKAKEQIVGLKRWPRQIYSVTHSVMSETITCSA